MQQDGSKPRIGALLQLRLAAPGDSLADCPGISVRPGECSYGQNGQETIVRRQGHGAVSLDARRQIERGPWIEVVVEVKSDL